MDWTYGSGQALRGAPEDLGLAMCGRSLPSGRLEGTPLGEDSLGITPAAGTDRTGASRSGRR